MNIILSIAGSLIVLLLGIIGYFLRKTDQKIDTLNKQMGEFAVDLGTINEKLISTTKDITDIKSNFLSLESNVDKKIHEQFKYVIENRERIVKLEVIQQNCPALNQIKKQ